MFGHSLGFGPDKVLIMLMFTSMKQSLRTDFGVMQRDSLLSLLLHLTSLSFHFVTLIPRFGSGVLIKRANRWPCRNTRAR